MLLKMEALGEIHRMVVREVAGLNGDRKLGSSHAFCWIFSLRGNFNVILSLPVNREAGRGLLRLF